MFSRLFGLPKVMLHCFRIDGFISVREAFSLYWMSYGRGRVVEIGSLMGKSTVCLASKRNHVTTVDHHRGSPELEGIIPDDTESILRHNLCHHGNVDIVVGRSGEAALGWSKPINFLFIDGCHDCVEVDRDFKIWGKWVYVDGIIAFHDYNMAGVRRVVNRVLASQKFELLGRVGSLVYLRKLK